MNQVFITICVSAALVARASTYGINGSKSVNLALETSLLFEPKDTEKHLKFIAAARNFLGKLESAIAPRKDLRSNGENYLTYFLNAIAETILYFSRKELHIFFKVLEFEMQTHFYKGSIFREILYDHKLLNYLRNKLKEWTKTDPRMMRAKLTKYISSGKNKNTSLNRLGEFLNGYYTADDNVKMKAIVEKLRNVREENELGAVIRDAINAIVIQHYDKMNYTTRAKITDEVNKLKDYIKGERVEADDDLKLKYRKFLKEFSDASEINNIDKKDSNETWIISEAAQVFVRAIDATVESRTSKEIVEDNVSVDNDIKINQHES